MRRKKLAVGWPGGFFGRKELTILAENEIKWVQQDPNWYITNKRSGAREYPNHGSRGAIFE